MSKSSLTKIITFTPFYMIQNCLEIPVTVWELDSIDHEKDMIEIGPGETAPFWPKFDAEAVSWPTTVLELKARFTLFLIGHNHLFLPFKERGTASYYCDF